MSKPQHLNLHVRYLAAPKPFVDPHAAPSETLQSVKARVLTAFDLKEIQDANQTVLYFLYKEDQKLENLALTLGELAGDHHELKLRLVQQIVQGDDERDLDAKCFDADLTEAGETEEAARWEVVAQARLELTVRMSPKREPKESYVARLRWDRYPANPPSLKFLDGGGSETSAAAWPQCAGFRPTAYDACVNWTREGMALHPEWRTGAATRWDPSGNGVLRVLNLVQEALDFQYTGRFRP